MRLIALFQKTEILEFSQVQNAKTSVERVSTAIVEQAIDNVVGCSSTFAFSSHSCIHYCTA